MKNILFIDVGGYVHFLSDTCEGKKNGKKLAKQELFVYANLEICKKYEESDEARVSRPVL
ncbi:hypothetical protein QUF74_18305 [Candidatus Halobeggiatoa sp. HSG11]|nr:hypothetical protein [Candidatus Halobeggiatoa sp. HSG11]